MGSSDHLRTLPVSNMLPSAITARLDAIVLCTEGVSDDQNIQSTVHKHLSRLRPVTLQRLGSSDLQEESTICSVPFYQFVPS